MAIERDTGKRSVVDGSLRPIWRSCNERPVNARIAAVAHRGLYNKWRKFRTVIHVCAITSVEKTIAASGASHLVTLLAAGTAFSRPAAIPPDNHLCLWMNDIAEMQAGLVAPGRAHVEQLVAFGRSWDRKRPLAVNCFAGISRSTAAAYILAAALSPDRDEAELAWTLRLLSPSATPNLALVRHADAILGRQGRMIEAIRAIGRGEDAYEGVPFILPLAG